MLTTFLGWRLHTLVSTSLVRAKAWADHRLDANPSARKAIVDGIQQNRVFIEPDFFDLFLPPSFAASPDATRSLTATAMKTGPRLAKVGLIFFPGALVEYRAYAGVARKLSDAGIVVLIFNTERYHRLPLEIFGCNMANVKKAASMLEAKYNIHVKEWSCGGHSLGGYTAQQVVVHQPSFFRSIILWGVYRELILGELDVNTLVVQATRDGVCKSFREGQNREDFLESLTWIQGRTLLYDIDGGNHSGFGDYPTQTFPIPDDERTISLEAMHTELAQVTSDFLLNEHNQ
jgi:hypothetical protein